VCDKGDKRGREKQGSVRFHSDLRDNRRGKDSRDSKRFQAKTQLGLGEGG
jgi:hypothetical protein